MPLYAGTDLSDLVAGEPPSSGGAGVGARVADMDDALVEARRCSKNSWSAGSGLAEHDGNGTHVIPYGVVASRPTVGYAGRLYLATNALAATPDSATQVVVQRDDGAAWSGIEVAEYAWRSFGGRRPDPDETSDGYVATTPASTLSVRLREYFVVDATYYIAFQVFWMALAAGSPSLTTTFAYESVDQTSRTSTLTLNTTTIAVQRVPSASYTSFAVASAGWKTITLSGSTDSGNCAIVGGNYRIYRGL